MRATVNAPDFPEGMSWLNVERPLSLKELRGKIVLLDFWTYCCINCIHIIPELKKLEERFPDTLVVIGVHAPKYYAEQVLDNVRQAVLRYDVEHPVVSDPNHRIWDAYAVSAWPTTALISPDGKIIAEQPGEFAAEDYVQVIAQVEAAYDREGKLNRSPIPMSPEKARVTEGVLHYPGKVFADPHHSRLFISDSGHHRILVTDFHGDVRAVIGSGQPGLGDGDFGSATFRAPQGLAFFGDTLYVADTENHAIREVDLLNSTVKRIAGTGEQARLSRRGGPGLSTQLSSPWDLALTGNILYIAMAGNHTIWALDLDDHELHRFAGTGREALSDGTLERCALAQTSGLSISRNNLYFADSETSAVRVARILEDRVETIVGEGLFDFGDVDGRGSDVRLQHCLGVAAKDGLLYVADSYNNKIKTIDVETQSSATLFGTGQAGLRDGPGIQAAFWEPGGLSLDGDILFIADTNNHAIRVADLLTNTVSTLEIRTK